MKPRIAAMSFNAVCSACAAILVASLGVTVSAEEALDQQNIAPPGSGLSPTDVQELAQTFTVGVSGMLSRVEFYIARATNPLQSLTISIYDTEGGVPTTALGSTIISGTVGSGIAEFRSADFSSFEIDVAAGEMLAFGVKKIIPDSGIHVMPYGTIPQYAGGGAFYRFYGPPAQAWVSSTGFDYGFKTYVLTEAAEELFGDYNDDDVIDAADYTVWRNAFGGGGTLQHDFTPAGVGEDDYDFWRAHYGESIEEGAGGAAVPTPEPTPIVLAVFALISFSPRIRRQQDCRC